MFLPLLTGERSPNWNASARGIISGLDLHHDKRHLVKAAMKINRIIKPIVTNTEVYKKGFEEVKEIYRKFYRS